MSESNPLLSNATMQGAAKHIESLMDTNGVIKEPQKEAAPVETDCSKDKQLKQIWKTNFISF